MQKRSKRLALRVLSTATFLAMVSSCTTAAFADTYDLTKGSVTVNAKSGDISYVTQKAADGSFCTNESGKTLDNYEDKTPVTLTTSGEEPTHNTASIYTEKGVSTTVTLDNVNIDASGTGKAAIDTKGKVTLELDGNNTLIGGDGHAALEKYSTASNGVADENYTLTLQDKTTDETTGEGKTGSLTATGGAGGAGIGGSVQTVGGYANNITITGGTVTATGGEGGAGIGGGKGDSSHLSGNKNGGNGDDITISGTNTTVTATGGEGGAGIGGGKGDGGSRSGQGLGITVKDGARVKATGTGGGAGIGGGDGSAGGKSSGLGKRITITGEGTTVTATGGKDGAGIGGGKGGTGVGSGQGYIIKVEDGAHVEATGGAEGGAGIGGGKKTGSNRTCGSGSTITISGGTTQVTANGNAGGAGIGGGKGSYGSTITVNDGTVTANGGAGGAGIGGGSGGQGDTITVSGGTVNANGSGGGAGIGSGDVTAADQTNLPRAAAIQISGGTVTATGGADGGAGIGGGKGTAASLKNGGKGVTITDGTVTATGGKGAAGIGSGADSGWKLGSFVDITGGKVTANGGAGEAAGIGNGEKDDGASTVKISATNAALDVTAVTQGSGEAITGENGVTMASLTNERSGVVRFFRSKNHYNTVHNGKYVGMDDNNADEHKKTDAHIWDSAKDEILQQATPAVRGIVRHHCKVDGCKGYYEEPFDYVAPAEPVNPAPTDPDTPDVPGTSDVTPDAPADAIAGAAAAKEVSVTPSRAQSIIAAALPQTGVNWLVAAVGSALSGIFLLAVGFVLNHKSRGQN